MSSHQTPAILALSALCAALALYPTAALAQSCPEPFPDSVECLTPEPALCLSEAALEQHEQDLADCRGALDKCENQRSDCQGRINEIRKRNNRLAETIDVLNRDVGRLKQRPPTWRAAIYGIAAALVGFAGGWLGQSLTQ